MRLGLVNFFVKGARFVRQELKRQAATQNAASTLIGSDDNQVD